MLAAAPYVWSMFNDASLLLSSSRSHKPKPAIVYAVNVFHVQKSTKAPPEVIKLLTMKFPTGW